MTHRSLSRPYFAAKLRGGRSGPGVYQSSDSNIIERYCALQRGTQNLQPRETQSLSTTDGRSARGASIQVGERASHAQHPPSVISYMG